MKKHLNRVIRRTTNRSMLEFLIIAFYHTGDSLTLLPDADYTDGNPNRFDRWCRMQQMLQGLWSIWSSEYFNSLQQRHKWKNPVDNLQRCTQK